MSWRKMPDTSVPDVTTDDIKIVEIATKISTPRGEYNVHYLDGLPSKGHEPKEVSLLLLHGMKFSSATWRQLGTIQLFCALGYRVIAVDLPGYGKTGGAWLARDQTVAFLGDFIAAVRISSPVIVSPSMSGVYSLPYVLQSPAPEIRGYVPIAPVDTDLFDPKQYKDCTIPTMIVYGENDDLLGDVSTRNLSAFSVSELRCIEGAGHACYLEKPAFWHKILYNFMLNIAL